MSVGHDGDIYVWSYPACQLLTTMDAHAGPIYDCQWSKAKKGSLVATASHDSTAMLWDFTDPLKPTMLQHLYGHTDCVRACKLDHTGSRLITVSYDKTAKVWDVDTGEELFCYEGHSGLLRVVVCHPSEPIVASAGDDRQIHVWKSEDGTLLQCLKHHTDVVFGLSFSPKGERLCSGSFDDTGKIFLWEEGYVEATFGNDYTKQIYASEFTRDGRFVGMCGESRINGVQSHVITLWKVPDIQSYSLADHERMKTGRLDEDILELKCVGYLMGHLKQIYCCQFNPEARSATAVTASLDKTIKVWDFEMALEDGMKDPTLQGTAADKRKADADRMRREGEMAKLKVAEDEERRRRKDEMAARNAEKADADARRKRERDEAERLANEEVMRRRLEREMDEKMQQMMQEKEEKMRNENRVTSREAQKLLDQLEAAKHREASFTKEIADMGYMINNVDSWVFDTDGSGKLQSVNATMLRSLGVTADDLQGLSLRQALETARTIDDYGFVDQVRLSRVSELPPQPPHIDTCSI